MKRYGSGISYLLDLDLEGGVSLINQAMEQSRRDEMYQLWVSIYPHMENPPTFYEFYRPLDIQRQTKTVSAEEAIKKAEQIRLADQGRR